AWLWLGFAAAAWLPPRAATGGVLVAALADPAPSWLGSRWGGGAPESLVRNAAVIVGFAAVLRLLHLSWFATVIAALVAGALERWSRPIDDNLVLAPGVAVVLWMVG